jgi:hypothetical protein
LVQILNFSAQRAFINCQDFLILIFTGNLILGHRIQMPDRFSSVKPEPAMKSQFLPALILLLFSCTEPVPISYGALPGMTRKDVQKRLGDPAIKGGFIHSQQGNQKKTPQKERFLLFYVYRDSSLVVFKKDTVFERFDHIALFRKRYGRRPIR